MSNPLTVLTASTTTGSKSDAPHGGARENKGARAFEDVMNEEVELNDPESLQTISKQKVVVEEQPDVEINDSVRTNEEPLSQNGDEELPNPEAASPQLLTLADGELQVPGQSEIAVPSPAVGPVSNQNISTSPTDQTNRSTAISSTAPAASEIPPAPEQKSDKVEKRMLTQTLGRSEISPNSNARQIQSRNSAEVGIRPDLDTPIASVLKAVSQQQTASATSVLISTQATKITPADTIRDTRNRLRDSRYANTKGSDICAHPAGNHGHNTIYTPSRRICPRHCGPIGSRHLSKAWRSGRRHRPQPRGTGPRLDHINQP